MSEPSAVMVLCAIPEDFDAEPLARTLIEQSLAACVQIGSDITSMYRWKGAVETSRERLILIKTRAELFARVEGVVRSFHPYEVPEIIAVKISEAHAPYLAWLAAETAGR